MRTPVLELRPTQLALGMAVVGIRMERLRRMSWLGLQRHVSERPVPVVRSGSGRLHLIDRHHLARACWEVGVDEVETNIVADLSSLDEAGFWREMQARRWVYLLDERGQGPCAIDRLPTDVRAMTDDPYRSLAWQVRRSGGFAKGAEPYGEFAWAEYFRSRVRIEPGAAGMKLAVEEALVHCGRPEASALPGFTGGTAR